MKFYESLRAVPGITSVVGSGGKSSLLELLGHELVEDGATVALATSTHFLPFGDMTRLDGSDLNALGGILGRDRMVCVGSPSCERTPQGQVKLGPPSCGFGELAGIADYVLVEADGSKRLPLKAHASWEPVIPEGNGQTVLVLGASGFGHPVEEVVHRSDLLCQRLGCGLEDAATPELIARELAFEWREGLLTFDRVLVNQVDEAGGPTADATRTLAGALARLDIDCPVVAGSLGQGVCW